MSPILRLPRQAPTVWGTAQSSGANAPGVTTGTGAGGSTDAAVNAENRLLDKKLKSICRGC
ncbi:hypothetical protein ACVWZ6_006582 [Bradyrhizobium sp. GM6.1]